MPPSDEQNSGASENRALLPMMVLVTLALGWILVPFYGAIMWGAIIAMLFMPAHRRLMGHYKLQRTSAALWTMALILIVLILPLALLLIRPYKV